MNGSRGHHTSGKGSKANDTEDGREQTITQGTKAMFRENQKTKTKTPQDDRKRYCISDSKRMLLKGTTEPKQTNKKLLEIKYRTSKFSRRSGRQS